MGGRKKRHIEASENNIISDVIVNLEKLLGVTQFDNYYYYDVRNISFNHNILITILIVSPYEKKGLKFSNFIKMLSQYSHIYHCREV